MGIWTPKMVRTLAAMRAEGHSSSVIAERLGVSRSAVLGKADREGIPRPAAPAAPKTPARAPREPRAPRVKAESPAPDSAVEPPPVVLVPPPPPLPSEPMRLETGGCCWPLNSWPRGEGHTAIFCCLPRDDGPYCPKHTAKAYTKAPVIVKSLGPHLRMASRRTA